MSSFISPHAAATALLLVSVLSVGSLLVGADYVSTMLPGGLPFGNALAATFFCGVSGAATLLAPLGKLVRPIALFSLCASIAWLPLSIALAGNASLNFSGKLGTVWLWCSAGLFLFVMAALLLAAGSSFWERHKKGKAA